MNALTGKPKLLKQANLSLIRRVIKRKGTATRAEIVKETKISSTTVRSLLVEMLESGEIESIGYDESSGGRKAERYHINQKRYFSVAFCMKEERIDALLVDICGRILEVSTLDGAAGNFEQLMIAYLDEMITRREIKSIGIGVPGVVEGGCFWKQDRDTGELYQTNISDFLKNRYNVPVVLENDLNATVIGIERGYRKVFPCEDSSNINMAYLHFEKNCVSAGFIAGGRVIRGSNNFAGEIGLIPMEDGRALDEHMAEQKEDVAYANLIIRVVCWICGVLNPQYVVLGGKELRKECIGPVSDGVYAFLPKHMYAQILYSPENWEDYHKGMASLTAEKMFDEVELVEKEV